MATDKGNRGIRSWLAGMGFLLLTLVAGAAAGADAPSRPAGMTQQQYDELVKSVGESVIQTLTDKGLVAKPTPAAATPGDAGDQTLAAERVVKILGDVPKVLGAAPDIATDLAQLADRLDRRSAGGRELWGFLGLLALAAAAALLAEAGVRGLLRPRRDAIAGQFAATGGLWPLAALALLDLLAVAALFIVIHAALGALFTKAGAQTAVAGIVLRSLLNWRLLMLLFRIYLRPGLAVARIAPVTDDGARRLMRLFEVAAAVAILALAVVALLTMPSAIAATMLINSVVVLAVFVLTVLGARRDVAVWLLGLIDEESRSKGIKAALARRWHWIALPILLLLGIARAYDALSDFFEVPVGAILTLDVIMGLLLAETLWAFIDGRRRAAMMATASAPPRGRLVPFLVRASRATLWVGAAWLLVRTWAVDVLLLVDEQTWGDFSRAWTTSVVTALLAYFAWEAVHFATERRSPRPGATGPETDTGQQPLSATRLETLAPILRILLGVVIFATAGLTILASLGVSITPFIAGASVFGLAISFGSQTLVHDIVSGLFYLADDAFRVGEYIDCGKAKGTVEGFTLRSIRLRHQSGQIHTIPFGQLGQITNFSRDWSTLKFNLRFVRDTDIDKLRKVTKKIGQAMFEDPVLKDDFLDPLKLQGVAEIADNATVMRFKMTVRPIRPSYIQREAIKRLIAGFKEAGIEFASATVAVHAIGGGVIDPAALAAAAASASQPAQTETA